jgi:polysaccharide deacetylase 2 family uncharacterized protein YibQ
MARRRVAMGRKGWQIGVAAVALAAGCGLTLMQLLPSRPTTRWSAAVEPPPLPRHAIRDPLAIGPEPAPPQPAGPPRLAAAVPPPLPAPSATPAPTLRPPGEAVAAALRPAPPERVPVAPTAAFVLPPPGPLPPGEAAWRHYAVQTGPEDGRPMIAIVIDDVGLDRRHSDEVSALRGPLTLSFMAYAEDLSNQVAAARAHGQEIMLHVPMEPLAARVDPGPNALRYGLDEDEIKRRMSWDLARIDGIVGVNNHMGSRFTEWPEGMVPVLEMLRQRGLFFLDSKTTAHSVGIELAQEMGLPHAARDIFLDDDMAAPAVSAELAKTEAVARRNGFAIAIGHPHPATILELRRWLPSAESRGFRLVTVSAIVMHNEVLAGHAQAERARD